MKFNGRKDFFTHCVWLDHMPFRDRLIIIYLFAVSNIEGRCSPGDADILAAIATKPGYVGNRNHVRSSLKRLARLGWIASIRKRPNLTAVIQLSIPVRFLPKERLPSLSEESCKIVQIRKVG